MPEKGVIFFIHFASFLGTFSVLELYFSSPGDGLKIDHKKLSMF